LHRGASLHARLWLLALLVAVAGCRPSTPGHDVGAHATRPVTLHVAAAADLQPTMPALVAAFRVAEPGVEVVPVFGSTGQLAEQIAAGAPFDVFFSANRAYVERLATSKDVDPASVHPYAIGVLVLAVGRDVKQPVNGLADLTRTDLGKVVLANPDTAPYGAAARQALQRAGLWETLRPKLVLAGSVRQAIAYVESGDAEVGLVGRSVADVPGVRVVDVDRSLYDPIVQALGIVARTAHHREAEAFVRFVLGDAGREVLRSHGFQLPAKP
jgi:molybdate transport system substrate-binding protein